MLSNNVTSVYNLLHGAGCQVTCLNVGDILNHRLRTADFDILVLMDNLPREKIVNQVKDFWLGGGGILSLDSGISYVCYAGMIPPESAGSENHNVYWSYVYSTNQVIYARHPVTKAYTLNQVIADNYDWAAFNWTALSATSVGSQCVRLTVTQANSTWANGVAFDPSSKGGRVVQLFASQNPLPDIEKNLIKDAVGWLCPHPKARIVYDLTHYPNFVVDSWDPPVYNESGGYAILRDALVSRGYTFDKLYPSTSGNLTDANLAPYDVLIELLPMAVFSASEKNVVANWVNSGKGLLASGDNVGYAQRADSRLNDLLSFTHMKMNLTLDGLNSVAYHTVHPTVEGCTGLSFAAPGLINYSSPAQPIWGNSARNIVAAGETCGKGRVILLSDINFLEDSFIGSADNKQYGINLFNWLPSGQSKTLVYVDDVYAPNLYRTPVAQAMNDLGLSWYLTGVVPDYSYFNMSLCLYNWSLVVVDNPTWPWSNVLATHAEIINYINAGGRFIMSYYDMNSYPSSPLWPRLGFGYQGNMPSSQPVYIWQPSNPVFTIPNRYGANRFVSGGGFMDEGDVLNVYANGTALAGMTLTANATQAAIVVGNNGRTLYNGYLIDDFGYDTDNSSYVDSFELWENEIAFMLPHPTIDSPTDIEYVVGTTGHTILWHPSSDRPFNFSLTINGSDTGHGPWAGASISLNVDGLAVGNHTCIVKVWDLIGYSCSDTVIVRVQAVPAGPLNVTTLALIALAVIAILVILYFYMKRSKSKS